MLHVNGRSRCYMYVVEVDVTCITGRMVSPIHRLCYMLTTGIFPDAFKLSKVIPL